MWTEASAAAIETPASSPTRRPRTCRRARASHRACRRCALRASFSRRSSSGAARAGGTIAGVRRVRAAPRALARADRASSPWKRAPAREHLVEHAAEGPDVGALVDGLPRACSGLMYAAVPRMTPSLRHRAWRARRWAAARRPRVSSAFARPKSSTFTVPSGVILTFAGFRSRWTMPARARPRALRRSGARSRSASSTRIGPRAIRSASVSPVDELHHERTAGRRCSRHRDARRCSGG